MIENNNNNQWRVIWNGDQDEPEDVRTWADAWALAQPCVEERNVGGGWIYTTREDALAAIANGIEEIIVAQTRDGTHNTVIRRIDTNS
jgi:hypothetical protein